MIDLGVGRVDVDHVDFFLFDRHISESVIEADRRLGQSVTRCQAAPAVGAANEFIRQTQFELRLPRQIRERFHLQSISVSDPHRERVAVVKAKWNRRGETQGLQCGVDLRERFQIRSFQNLQRNRSAVFGIQVNRAGLERRVHDGGIAQSRQQFDRRVPGRRFAEHMRKNIRLGKSL